MIVKRTDISNRLRKISELIVEQTEHGAQTKIIQKIKPNYYSLGQFLKELKRTQRGIHGSATALRVLADSDKNNLINGLTRYLEERKEIEEQITDNSEKIDESKLARDSQNTIKLSEILYSLKFVKAGSANTESLITNIAAKIKNSAIEGEAGWGYYLDKQSEVELLPSAFAILGLYVNGFKMERAVENIKIQLKSAEIDSPTKFAIVVFCLYALLNGVNELDKNRTEYQLILNRIWKSPYCSLKDLQEQNIEYWVDTHHDYVRIPWQFYLLAITSEISPEKFYTLSSQRLLSQIVCQDEFRYKYSGPYISTRTNAILYVTLSQIQENIRGSVWHRLLLFIDQIRSVIGSVAAKYILILLGLLAMAISVFRWLSSRKADLSELAPELLAGFIFGLIALGKKK
jgi:hypothetical protein